ncbi:MAG: formylmethanofuran dehydrogenase subunit B [Planctomycetia bacterium]|nr:formylmethanofuran dehydrogenase subunit B [Planctomycetia bacterium]
MPLAVTKFATCAGCACVCDDLELTSDGERIVEAKNACEMGRSWFLERTTATREATIDEMPVSLDDAIERAAKILNEADSPLVFGLGETTAEAQREAVALAERLDATLDTETSLTHGTMELAAQLGGKVTGTLGEIRNRADLAVYWGANPVKTHPRHLERYSIHSTGKYRSRTDRTFVVVDVRESETAKEADVFLKIRPEQDFEALTALRCLVRGQRIDREKLAETGLSFDQLRDLAERLKRARYGVIFVGMGLLQTRGKHMNASAATSLGIALNATGRFLVMPLRTPGNIGGADAMLDYATGYPYGVNFSRRYPRYNPGEFTAADLLERQDVDAALIVGANAMKRLPDAARKQLDRIPTIVINREIAKAAVSIATAPAGISASGTVYRNDKIPIGLRPPIRSSRPSDEYVLRRIRDAIPD